MSTSFCSLPLLHMILTTLNAVNGHCRCLKSGMPGPPIPPLGSHKFNPNGTWEKILKPAPFNTNLPGPTEQGKGSFSAFFFSEGGRKGLKWREQTDDVFFLKSFLVNIMSFSWIVQKRLFMLNPWRFNWATPEKCDTPPKNGPPKKHRNSIINDKFLHIWQSGTKYA